ncbi:hypothetical protein HAP48_0037500 [Bradyrhizobium septentrionale]|uniref:Uncharacterized protein n=1 Tax=Bradyrhizobium septentrionale TaxID=1404411 RepID=A0A973W0X3_9BRAD|nr:hypothetical protein [Bradyrhizobium septentrionale]UGY14214.1 hypothetical protein HAP48_0037500 [Bradyrhizobium septentrionale]
MVNRVLFQAGAGAAMSVSLPGVDVTAANIDQMVFDSRWSGHQFYASGTLDSSNDSVATFVFPAALDAVPFLAGYTDTNITLSPGTQYLGFTNFRGNSSDYWVYAQVTTTSLQFRFKFGNAVGRLYYALFRRIAG